MNKRSQRTLAGLLSFLLLFNSLSLDVRAISLPDVSDGEYAQTGEEVFVDISGDENADFEEETGDTGPERFFYRNLSSEEQEMKSSMSLNMASFTGAKEGTDYVSSQVIALATDATDAEEIRLAYEKATGYTVSLVSFNYGVAVYDISGKPAGSLSAELKSINPTGCLLKMGSEKGNNLPAVYPNYRVYPMVHNYRVNNENESDFTDPLTKFDVTSDTAEYYQWFHETINDKFVWKAMEEGVLDVSALEEVGVLVLDTGIDADHGDFEHSLIYKTNFAHKRLYDVSGNFLSLSGELEDNDGTDTDGHGTNVCGIIAADANTLGGRGVAAGVKLISGRVLSEEGGFDSELLEALMWAYSEGSELYNIKVINMSLGGSWNNPAYSYIYGMLQEKGILTVASAGNDNSAGVSYPASYEGVVSVAALNSDYSRATFSNYGRTVDIAAPGGDRRGQPGFDSQSDARLELIWSAGADCDDNAVEYEGELYEGMMGTSQAAPVVSAAAALVFAYEPYCTPAMVEAILKKTAKKINTDKPVGAGCVDVAAALGLDTTVRAPGANRNSGSVLPMTASVLLGAGNGIYSEDQAIYYTLDGTTPNPFTNPDSTLEYNDKIQFTNQTGKVTVKAVTLLYGKFSPVSSFTYTFDDKAVRSVTLESQTGYYDVAEGKKLQMKVTFFPATASNKKVIWTTNSSSVTVSSTGLVSARDMAGKTVTVTAASAENPDIKASREIKICEPANQIVFTKDTLPVETIEIEQNAEAVIGSSIKANVYPGGASQNVTLSSSNTGILSVTRNEMGAYAIKGIKTGTCKLTAVSTDGTDVKASVNVKVTTPVRTIDIVSATGVNAVAWGRKISFNAIFNEGKSVPDNRTLTWEITDGREYADINAATGQVTVKAKPDDAVHYVTVQASGSGKVSNKLDIRIYPEITGFYYIRRADGSERTEIIGITGMEGRLSDWVMVENAEEACPYFTYQSSKPDVVSIKDDGAFVLLKGGSSILTMTVLDGSGKKGTLKVSVTVFEEGIGLTNKSGTSVLYPGKTITYKVQSSTNKGLKDYKLFLADSSGEPCVSMKYANVTGYSVKALKNMENITPGEMLEVYLCHTYKGNGNTYIDSREAGEAIECYPVGTKSLVLSRKNLELQIGDFYSMGVSSLPENACQKHYTYKSSNTGVCEVYADGTIEAKANGTAVITVTAGDGSKKSATCKVKVNNPVTELGITAPNNGFVALGKTIQLRAQVNSDAGNKKINWAIVSETVRGSAAIDVKGKLKAKKAGSTIVVRASATDGSGISDTYTVRITGSNVVSLGAASLNMFTGESRAVAASCKGTYIDDEGQTAYVVNELKVTSSNKAVASVVYDVSGEELNITAHKPGKVKITVASVDGSSNKTMNVAVTNPVTSLRVVSKTGKKILTMGKTLQMVANTNSDATNKKVTWSIAGYGASFATISSTGLLSINKNLSKEDLNNWVGPRVISVTATSRDGMRSDTLEGILVYKESVGSIGVKDAYSTGENYSSSLNLKLGTLKTQGSEYETEKTYSIKVLDTDKTDLNCPTGVDVKSSNSKVATVSYDSANRKITVKAVAKGKAVITLSAQDASGKKAVINVTVVEPVTKISVYSVNGSHIMTGGSSLQLAAAVNDGANNKALEWYVAENYYGCATVSDKGLVKINGTKLWGAGPFTVKINARARDGSNVTGESFEIKVYFKSGGIVIKDGAGNGVKGTYNAQIGTVCTFDITSKAPGVGNNTYGDYMVTYSSGYGAMSYISKNASGTSVKFIPSKAGTVTVTVKALDGSGMKTSFKIKVTK